MEDSCLSDLSVAVNDAYVNVENGVCVPLQSYFQLRTRVRV